MRALPAGRRALALVVLLGVVGACSGPPPAPPAAPEPAVSSSGASAPVSPTPVSPTTAPVEPVEPTTTNTLAPPPAPTAPAPSTAGTLDAADLPVPRGWRTVARQGGEEEGYQGNGSWVHARDPRYAATDAITIGCADITRDDFPDPVAALEGTYEDARGNPGVGLVLDFADAAAADRYWSRYTEQVQACPEPTRAGPAAVAQIEVLEIGDGLLDRRRYPDGDWTEVARRTGSRVTLVILSEAARPVSERQARVLLAQLG